MSLRVAARVKELRLHLCQKGAASKGVRDFIEKHYVSIKQSNPKVPILIRECGGVQPVVWARYEQGKENCANLSNLSAEDVLSKVQSLTK